jgi:hypothetical protein
MSETSFRKQDNCCVPKVKQCINQTCGQWFDVTEDIRQLYCCEACSKTEHSRRRNKRKRDREEAKQKAAEHASRRKALRDSQLAQLDSMRKMEVIGPLVKPKDKEQEMNDRTYIVVYDYSTNSYNIAFRDYNDPINMYTMVLDMPSFPSRGTADMVCTSLNMAQR